ncbi:tyrosine-type recombinase/integrase [Pseudomonas sp. GX19020]|uniref:tyrosine-type recombinase/integrase n=1 Tax=Pseudomonas sp. GX19020 TaxID=2942277 RepID=UPI00201880FE|nr:tyrosine-type recombinase/integrase [Pseudomonas sp. GX19020]MCL4065308.1 tyrosine-type recombinase/integrase [Pseudomonas sp. GX19020]
MTKRDLPAHCYRKGKRGYIYFVRGKLCQRIKSSPGTADFAVEYATLMKGRVQPAGKTISKLIEHYRTSPRWAKLARNTRIGYERNLAYFDEVAGRIDPSTLRRVHINQMRDALADRPTDANRKISTLSVLFEHGIDIGWLTANPAKGVRKLDPTGRQRQPWPTDMIEAFREAANPRTLLLFELLIGTGQRITDVLSLRWSDLDSDGFTLTQGKTKTRLYIPLTDRLRAILAATPRRALFIVAQDNGNRVGYNLAWKDVMATRRAVGAEAYDIHGLRYTAASEIASIPGMTSEHVKAITGHAEAAMVRLYAGPAMQKARAAEAQKARGNGTNTKHES